MALLILSLFFVIDVTQAKRFADSSKLGMTSELGTDIGQANATWKAKRFSKFSSTPELGTDIVQQNAAPEKSTPWYGKLHVNNKLFKAKQFAKSIVGKKGVKSPSILPCKAYEKCCCVFTHTQMGVDYCGNEVCYFEQCFCRLRAKGKCPGRVKKSGAAAKVKIEGMCTNSSQAEIKEAEADAFMPNNDLKDENAKKGKAVARAFKAGKGCPKLDFVIAKTDALKTELREHGIAETAKGNVQKFHQPGGDSTFPTVDVQWSEAFTKEKVPVKDVKFEIDGTAIFPFGGGPVSDAS